MSTAILEFSRLLTGAANLKQPRNPFGSVTLFILIFHCSILASFIQSWLSAISTEIHRSSNIDSVEDLIESKFEIHGSPIFKQFIPQDIRNRYHYVSYLDECDEWLLKGDRIACIHQNKYIDRFYDGHREYVHASKGNLVRSAQVHTCAEGFPLISRFNWISSKLSEGGIIELVQTRFEHRAASKIQNATVTTHGIGMKDLAVNFHLLFVSWVVTIFAFLAEIAIHTIKSLSSGQTKIVCPECNIIKKVKRAKVLLFGRFFNR